MGVYDYDLPTLLSSSPAGDSLSIYSSFSLAADTSVYNTNLWGGGGSQVDFTGIGHRTSPSSAYYCKVVALTKRHAIHSTHTSTGCEIGDEVTWIGANGTRYARTVIDRSTYVSGTGNALYDYDVLYLSSDLPASIETYPLLADTTTTVTGLPVVKTNQSYQAHVCVVQGTDLINVTFTTAGSNPIDLYAGSWVLNDSGCPAFFLNGRQLIFIAGATQSALSGRGPFVIHNYADIVSACATLDAINAQTGYTPTTFSLSNYRGARAYAISQ